MTGPTPPPASCPIGWQPSALTPVFHGMREYSPAEGAPTRVRVFFPSLDGAVATAPILDGCGRYPLIIFAHGHCANDPNHFRKWIQLPAQLARSGYVVAVPELTHISILPQNASHPSVPVLGTLLNWMRQSWEHSDVLMPAEKTGVAGHSYGALLTAWFATVTPTVAAYAGLSGTWQELNVTLPIAALNRPKLIVAGHPAEDSFTELNAAQWSALPIPRHRATFANGRHFDYLPAGQTPCDPERGPCPPLALAAADLVTMFFAKYLWPEHSPHLPGRVPDNLVPPPLNLTPEQEFYAGSHLIGMPAMTGANCAYTLDFQVPLRPVPHVVGLPMVPARQQVIAAGFRPTLTGLGTWVSAQSPAGGSSAPSGSTVRLTLRSGPIP
ncbi:PASTA domain-containing protein [Polymorphospora sp. NPDC051019]|uniref:PASTA domain-containing protein n=1 Tax=Polymorphospora lycopeni TaxID=3140240 RepID=A0ABV5CTT7_9ACTN